MMGATSPHCPFVSGSPVEFAVPASSVCNNYIVKAVREVGDSMNIGP